MVIFQLFFQQRTALALEILNAKSSDTHSVWMKITDSCVAVMIFTNVGGFQFY